MRKGFILPPAFCLLNFFFLYVFCGELFRIWQFSPEIVEHLQQKMPYAAKGRNTCSAATGGNGGIGGP
jgi:hypothetical protein